MGKVVEQQTDPEVRNVGDLWAWMNTWGDLYAAHREGGSSAWRGGYRTAIRDLMSRLEQMGVTDCSDEAWERFTGRR